MDVAVKRVALKWGVESGGIGPLSVSDGVGSGVVVLWHRGKSRGSVQV